MYHKELVAHVYNRLLEGASREQIAEELSRDGWGKADVKDAIFYSMFPNKLRHFSFRRLFRSEIPVSIAVVFLSFALTGFSLVLIAFQSQAETLNYSVSLPALPERQGAEFTYGEIAALSNPDFFSEVKQKFIESGGMFIEADLSNMVVRVWNEGTTTVEVPVKTKGREGSWWETPAGIYKISSQERTHFSGMGNVHMPYSMRFQGNFYIHGWPYYPGGKPVSSTYSGGCIRLADEDAKKVFEAVSIGTPILVYEKDFSSDGYEYEYNAPSFAPDSYIAADLLNNFVFIEKDAQKVLPIASITKLMTALVATEYINLDATATVPQSALVYTSKPRLKAGDAHSVYQLLFPLLLESSNEAAEAIARHYGRESFIAHMNEKAASIGMKNTIFADASGASSENVSTAEDLFMLAKYIYNNRSFIFKITSGKVTTSAYGDSGFSDLRNFNDFIENEFFIGGKNGETRAAKQTGVSVFELPVSEGKRPIVFIALGSEDRVKDMTEIIDYSLEHFWK